MEGPRPKRVAVAVCALMVAVCTIGQGRTFFVDDDAAGTGDGTSWDNAFTHLQDALAIACHGDEIRVAQGTYKPDRGATFAPSNRDATFTLVDGVAMLGGFAGSTAVDPNARDIQRYQTILSVGLVLVARRGGGSVSLPTPTFVRCRFIGNRAIGLLGGAIYNAGTTLTTINCLVAGNSALDGAGLFNKSDWGSGAVLMRCTLAQNRSEQMQGASDNEECQSTLDHCIVWGHDGTALSDSVSAVFSDIEGSWPGEGNIDIDPLFAAPGHWHGGAFCEDDSDNCWADGDYHLQSQGLRWDPVTEDWVQDTVTSPCIDAGDPEGPIGDEPFPNGGVMNLGAYAGTAQASKSYFGTEPCDRHLAGDINGDGQVGLADLLIIILQWTEETETVLNR